MNKTKAEKHLNLLRIGLADPAHYATESFKNMWVRIPGSTEMGWSEAIY